MVFINTPFDVTIGPPGMQARQDARLLRTIERNTPGMSLEQAKNVNRIYQGNGLICQVRMCGSITGCNSPNGCPNNPHWKDILDFCGKNSTPGMSMDGSWWSLEQKDAPQLMLARTEKAVGMAPLPNPYNVVGMYK